MTKLSCGIVGLPNVGKSTLFNALTRKAAASANYPFCTIDPNVGIVDLNDPRLGVLSNLSNSEKIVYAPVQFVDIAGLVKGAAKGEGLGNQFLAHIRETDAIVHVVRCFEDENIIHVAGGVDPIEDIETVNLELILADFEMINNVIPKIEKQAKSNKEMQPLLALLKRIAEHLDQSKPVRSFAMTREEKELLMPYPFLTQKKVLYCANVAEKDLPSMDNHLVKRVREYAAKEGSLVVPICAQIEAEVAQLEQDDQTDFLADLGLTESGLTRLIRHSFEMLDLITFFTTGEMETRAWTLNKGATAPEAAGKIHTDIEKGFIRAEVVAYEDFVSNQGRAGARDTGKLRFEGRDYLVQDGDVILFYHN